MQHCPSIVAIPRHVLEKNFARLLLPFDGKESALLAVGSSLSLRPTSTRLLAQVARRLANPSIVVFDPLTKMENGGLPIAIALQLPLRGALVFLQTCEKLPQKQGQIAPISLHSPSSASMLLLLKYAPQDSRHRFHDRIHTRKRLRRVDNPKPIVRVGFRRIPRSTHVTLGHRNPRQVCLDSWGKNTPHSMDYLNLNDQAYPATTLRNFSQSWSFSRRLMERTLASSSAFSNSIDRCSCMSRKLDINLRDTPYSPFQSSACNWDSNRSMISGVWTTK